MFTACHAAKSLQSCPTLCHPIDSSPPGFPVPGILQARTLEWVAISFSNAWKWKVKSESEVIQSCLILCDPMDCSLPGSSIHGIFQARVLEWGAIAFSVTSLSLNQNKNITYPRRLSDLNEKVLCKHIVWYVEVVRISACVLSCWVMCVTPCVWPHGL